MKKFLIFAAVATMFAACSQNDDLVLQDKDTPIAIASAGVNDLVASRNATSLTEGSLGLYVGGTDLDKYTATNLQWTYESGEWKNKGDELYFAGAGKQSAYAYHPYNATAYTNGFTTNGTTDLLWWKSASTLSAASLNISFTHALSLLTINLKKGTNVTEHITGVKVGGTKVTATPNFPANTWSEPIGEATDITATVATPASGMDATYTALLIPQTTGALKITVTAGNRTFVYTHSTDETFAPGTAYTLTITVGADNVEAGTISAAGWNIGETGENDNLVTE